MIGQSTSPVQLPSASSMLWPKRAVKACANCRHDKIKCEDGRPCGGCRKKGLSAEQCVNGCEACRRARVRCEGGSPCDRCHDMQLACEDDSAQPKRLSRTKSPQNVKTERAKLACKACRRDNKKCEDERPCGRCIVRGEDCVHVARGPKLVKARCQACRDLNKRCEDVRPCRFCVERQCDCVDPPRKGKGHGTRVKAACMNCRHDKIRCDGQRPCLACSRKGLFCQDRPLNSSSWSETQTQTSSSTSGSPREASEPESPYHDVVSLHNSRMSSTTPASSDLRPLPPVAIPPPYNMLRPHVSPPPPALLYSGPAPHRTTLPPLRTIIGPTEAQARFLTPYALHRT
ncbi:hypothetical protein FA95DRAFT_609027 [Auriscalpium vulgare]|uniref:Uncharacterized protein n=1 Tax=Auriscalpium vulgare TaxID=40419 RepID=A0ACB8RE68_9AGAM|nr:hypothetical protein FA95DRAFT_609027 [Auriscalpium vulgare]